MTKREEEKEEEEEEKEEPRCFESKVGALFKRKEERHRECVRFIFATRFAVEMKNPERRGMRIRRRSGGGFFGFFLISELEVARFLRKRGSQFLFFGGNRATRIGGSIPEESRFTIPFLGESSHLYFELS